MILTKILTVLFQFLYSKLYLIINKKMIFNIRRDLVNCVLNLEMNNFSDNNRGIFIDKLKSDPNEIARIFNSIKDFLIRGFGNLGIIIYICCLDYRLGLIVLVFTIIIFLIMMKGIKIKKKYRREFYNDHEKYSAIIGEMINGVDDIKNLDFL